VFNVVFGEFNRGLVSLITCLGEYRCLVSLITSGEFNHGL
jgi:hypothetical protein